MNSTERPFWETRHIAALRAPMGEEKPIVNMIQGWSSYAARHLERLESKIGDDYVLGPAWESIGKALLVMLNGELGRLDAGTLDEQIRDSLTLHGFDGDTA